MIDDFALEGLQKCHKNRVDGVDEHIIHALDRWKLSMSHFQMLGKVESGGGPIFKVVLEC